MTTLIITLTQAPPDTAALYNYVLTPEGSTVQAQSCAPLALLPLTCEEVIVLIPARYLSWHQVQLPPGTLGKRLFQEGGAARLRVVLAGLLEDRLLDDTEQLHFALAPQARTEVPVWVAVCERSWLHAHLQALEQAGLRVNHIKPEFEPDATDETLSIMGEPEAAHMTFTNRGGVAVWPVSAASVALLNWPEDHRIVAEPAVAALAEHLFKRTVTLQQSAQRSLQALQSPWDLAQFELVNSSRARTWKRCCTEFSSFWRAPRWRAARVALLALVVINLAGLQAWAWQEKTGLLAQRTATREVLTNTFPHVRVVVDAPIQMAREVAALHQASGVATGRDLEAMMNALMAAAPATTVPEALDFTVGELRLKGLALKPEELSELAFKLTPQGYAVSIEDDRLVMRQGAGL